MTNIQTGIALNHPGVRALDMSKIKMFKMHEASEELYQRFVSGQEKFLESQYSQAPNTAGNPAYKPYATVTVDGKTVAEIDNHGWVSTSNAVGGQLAGAFSGEPAGQNGPMLAQARAERIAELLGGKVEKSASALTQSQFMATPQPSALVDTQAMMNDPMYEQLQKTKEARTLFLAQQYAQSSEGQHAEVEAAATDARTEFLEYMAKSPEERLYEAMLKERGLTKEQFEALPPEERAKIENEIQEEIEERVETQIAVKSEEGTI